MHLHQTTKDVLERILEAEKKQCYSMHVDSQPSLDFIPIDASFSYHKTISKRVGYFFVNQFLVKPYRFYANHIWLQTEIVGKQNIKSISSGAILTCNHVNKLDSLVVGHALKDRHIRYTAAEFNNLKGRLGCFMRAHGMLSIPSKQCYMRKFSMEVTDSLKKKDWILFFPEGSEWWCYEKPRPYQTGAFHFAAKHHVPIVPLFITFKKTTSIDSMGLEKRKFILHILRPIYPKNNLSLTENKAYLKEENERVIWDCYKRFYSI